MLIGLETALPVRCRWKLHPAALTPATHSATGASGSAGSRSTTGSGGVVVVVGRLGRCGCGAGFWFWFRRRWWWWAAVWCRALVPGSGSVVVGGSVTEAWVVSGSVAGSRRGSRACPWNCMPLRWRTVGRAVRAISSCQLDDRASPQVPEVIGSVCPMTDSVAIEIGDDYVATIELRRPPNNFFSLEMIAGIADALESLDDDPRCRAAVLLRTGQALLRGAPTSRPRAPIYTTEDLYAAAVRIFRTHTRRWWPRCTARRWAAAWAWPLRPTSVIAAPEARFSANLRPPGVPSGLRPERDPAPAGGPARRPPTCCTPRRRVPGEEAAQLGLADRLVPRDEVRSEAHTMAREIAMSAPLAVRSIRATHARRPGRPSRGGHVPRAPGAGPPPAHGRLRRGNPGHGRAQNARVPRRVTPATLRGSGAVSSAWLERLLDTQEVRGSNPLRPTP